MSNEKWDYMDVWCHASLSLTIGGGWSSTFGMGSKFKSIFDDASTTPNAMSTD